MNSLKSTTRFVSNELSEGCTFGNTCANHKTLCFFERWHYLSGKIGLGEKVLKRNALLFSVERRKILNSEVGASSFSFS